MGGRCRQAARKGLWMNMDREAARLALQQWCVSDGKVGTRMPMTRTRKLYPTHICIHIYIYIYDIYIYMVPLHRPTDSLGTPQNHRISFSFPKSLSQNRTY